MKEFKKGFNYVSFFDENEKLSILRQGNGIFFHHESKEPTEYHQMMVTKEDYELFNSLRTLDRDIRAINDDDPTIFNYNIIGDHNLCFYTESYIYPPCSMGIENVDDDSYRLSFTCEKPSKLITVQIGDADYRSLYAPYDQTLIKMYESLREIDPNCRQINIEEYEYQLRMKKHQ